MPKIVKPTGRESLEEFGLEGRDEEGQIGDGVPRLGEGGPLDPLSAATSTFPNEDERLDVLPEGAPLSGSDYGSGDVQGVDQFNFLKCDPLLPGEEPEPCPVCRENQYAYVPDFKLLDDGDVFFNGKNCTQNVVILADSPVLGGPTSEDLKQESTIESYKREGIRRLLEAFNKSDIATVYYYERDPNTARLTSSVVGAVLGAPFGIIGSAIASNVAQIPTEKKGYTLRSEEKFVIDEILPFTDYQFSIPMQRNARTRILVSIPVEYLDRVPTRLLTQPTAEFQTNLEVTIDGSEFAGMSRRLQRTLRVYNNKYKRWRNLDGGRFIRTGQTVDSNMGLAPEDEYLVNLDDENKKLGDFTSAVTDMLRQGAGFTIPDSASFKGGQFSGQNIEKITFKFDLGEDGERLLLKQVITNKPGCPNVVFAQDSQEEFGTGKAFVDFMLNGQAQRFSSTTLFFAGALPDIDTVLQAREQMPWIEFLTKYLYPQVEVFYGSNPNTDLNNPSALECLGASAMGSEQGGRDFPTDILESILDIGISLPDQIVQNFANKTCKTREELLEEYRKLSQPEAGANYAQQYKTQLERIKQIQTQVVEVEDPTLEIIIEEFQSAISSRNAAVKKSLPARQRENEKAGMKKAKAKRVAKKESREQNKLDINGIFKNIFDRIGVCGFLDLAISAADCVAKGLGEDDALGALTEAAFNAMEDVHLERIFVGLSPEKQEEVFGIVRENFEGLPAPWDIGYIAGDYNGPGLTPDKINGSQAAEENELERTRQENQAVLNLAGLELPPGSDLSQFGNQSPGSGGVYGRALGNVQKEIFDAYRGAILDAVGYDELLNGLNNLPGAPIVAGLIRQIKYNPCVIQIPSLAFEPRLDSFLNTLEADICQWDGTITLPKLNPDGKFKENILNLFRILGLAIIEALKAAALAIAMEILKLVLEKVLSIACDSIATLGANMLDLFQGSDHFKNLLKDNMCPNASDDQLYDALKLILDTASGPDSTCLERLTNAEMGAFIDDISLMLTQGQVIQLLTGTTNEETIRLALEVVATSSSDTIRECFSNPDDLVNFFRGLGVFIPNLGDLADSLAPGAFDRTVHPCPDDIADIINDLRCQLLSEKGLSPQECRDQIDDLKDQALKDLGDLADILQNGPFSNFPPLDSAPGCPPDGFNPAVDPANQDLNAAIANTIFERIEESHLRDLMSPLNIRGRGGVLNAIMADTRGRPLRYHNWLVGTLGSPLSTDLGLFEFYSDNSIRDPSDPPNPFQADLISPKAVDIYGNELKAIQGDFGISIGRKSYGGFPPTVGSWMAKQLQEFSPTFKTELVPDGGFTTPSDALNKWTRVDSINQGIISQRVAYLEAFFVQFKFDEGGISAPFYPVKYARARSDMLRAVTSTENGLFIGDLDNTEEANFNRFPGYSDYSGEERAWNALTGKNISIGGKLFGSKKVSKWRQEAKNILVEAGLSANITDYRDIAQSLLEYPDTSSSDISLKFSDFGDDPEQRERSLFSFDLGYDYNLFDQNGVLKKSNDYSVRLDISYESANGRRLSSKQLRKRGDVQVPPSILSEGKYTYTKFEILSKGSIEQDIFDNLESLGIYQANVADSYQIQAMYNFFTTTLLRETDNVPKTIAELLNPDVRNYFANNGAFDKVSSGFLARIAKSVATGRSDLPLSDSIEEDFLAPTTEELSTEEQTQLEQKRAGKIALNTISPAFRYGYDPELEPTIEYLGIEEYGGFFARTLVKIRGTEEGVPKPFYVQEQKFGGWMDLIRRMVPEVDGCEPARTPMFKLDDVARNSSRLCTNLVPDERLKSDPLCAQETPYNKILENGPASNIDGAIRAIARIYIVDTFIRATPSFVMFALTNENYDDLLPAYIAQKMKQGLAEDGRLFNGRNSNTYYYRVLEQCYNTVLRKINSNLLNPETDLTDREKQAKSIIDGKIAEFEIEYTGKLEMLSSAAISAQNFMQRALTPKAKENYGGPKYGFGSAKFSKKQALAAKRVAFDALISETESEALVFLERYIREEFEAIKEVYGKNIPSFVDNVDHLFLLSDTWVNGGVLGNGPFNVQSSPMDSSTHNIKVGTPVTVQRRLEELENVSGSDFTEAVTEALRASFESLNQDWPFVLEKYIRIEEKQQPSSSISDRGGNLYNVVNIQDWDEYVKQKKAEGLEGNISDLWEGWRFGLRLSYKIEDDKAEIFDQIMETISQEKIMNEKTFILDSPDGKKFIIPIAEGELPIPDQEFTLFDPEAYDVYCLIRELIKTIEYRTWFRYMFPLRRFNSLIAIYIAEGFFASLGASGFPGDGGDMWEVPGGRKGSGFRRWARGDDDVFVRSRKDARDIFTSFYDSAASIDFSSENNYNHKTMPNSVREFLRPRVNFEDGLRWWQRGRRLRNRPFDKDGDECPDE